VIENVEMIRAGTGDPKVPIHYLGGVSYNLDIEEVRGFVQGVIDTGIHGAGLYNFRGTTLEMWDMWRMIGEDKFPRLKNVDTSVPLEAHPEAKPTPVGATVTGDKW
jgi:hypothetical protein